MGLYKTPHEATQYIVASGVKKGRGTVTGHLVVRAFMAGCYISFGGLFAVIAGGGWDPAYRTANPALPKLLYGFVFPVGLIAVILEGSELFTSNIMYLSASVLERKASLVDLVKNWTFSWVFNFLGSLFVAYALVYVPDLFGGSSSTFSTYIISVAHKKVSTEFGHLVLKGIGCNWLVCLAVCFAITAESVEGKLLGIYPPIWCFVACGFEHSVANMFFIPVAMLYSPDTISVGELFANLLPVTIGNIIGGAIFVALPSWYLLPSSGPFAHAVPEEPVPLLPLFHESQDASQQLKLKSSSVAPADGEHAVTVPLNDEQGAVGRRPSGGRRPSTVNAPMRTGLALGLSTQALGMRAATWGHAPGSVLGQTVPALQHQDVPFLDGLGVRDLIGASSAGSRKSVSARTAPTSDGLTKEDSVVKQDGGATQEGAEPSAGEPSGH